MVLSITIAIILALISASRGASPAPLSGFVDQFSSDFILDRTTSGGAIEGFVSGRMHYDASFGSRRGAVRWEYRIRFPGTGTSLIQIDDYPSGQQDGLGGVSYLWCGAECQAQVIGGTIPIVYPTTGMAGGSVNVRGRTCNTYTAASPSTELLWENGVGPCRVQYTIPGGTMDTITFLTPASTPIRDSAATQASGLSNPVEIVAANIILGPSGFPANTFVPLPSWNCPAPSCLAVANIYMVLDESGSISPTNFDLEQQFAVDIGGSFTFGINGVAMGAAFFSGNAVEELAFTINQNTYTNGINNHVQRGGATCIGCGLNVANTAWNRDIFGGSPQLPGRSGFPNICITLTDGENNVGSINPAANDLRNLGPGVTILAVGVGSSISQSTLLTIAGGIQSNVFQASNFNDLQNFVDQLSAVSCTLAPPNPCGAGCLGFCACSQECICPDFCDDGEACTNDLCTANQNGNGCRYPTFFCDDGSACTDDVCTPGPGFPPSACGFAPNMDCASLCDSCNDNDPCTFDGCDGSVPPGVCVYTPVPAAFCDDGNVCTTDTCVAGQGCVYTDISAQLCNDGNVCTIDTCNSAVGCQYNTRDCNSESPFSLFRGDCQQAACDPDGNETIGRAPGCFLTPFSSNVVDECGVCNGDGSTCASGLGAGAAAGIGIGGIIGILLGLACLALAGLFAGKKGYDYYQGLDQNLEGAQENPAHQENKNQGTNFMYEE